jgi:hypothetical protein
LSLVTSAHMKSEIKTEITNVVANFINLVDLDAP